METNELHKKINIVLDEEVRSYSANGRRRGGLGSMNIGLQSMPNNGWTTEGEIPQLLFPESNVNVIVSSNASLLVKLYSSLDKEEKENFVNYLSSHLRKVGPYTSIGYFIFFVLYRVGEIIKPLKFARLALSGDTLHGYSNLLGILSMIISREYLSIDPKIYEDIKLILLGDTESDFQLKQKINLALLKHMERELSDISPEINSDRDKVIEIWGEKFTTPVVPSLIKEIDDYFREGELSDSKLATCIGRIRVLLIEIAKRISLGLATRNSDTTISESSSDSAFLKYLEDKQFISSQESQILGSLYGMASNQGAHSPISKREYARLIKNMSYEISLLMLSRYKV